MFPTHIPSQQAFNWYCHSNNIPKSNLGSAASEMREPVQHIRKLYRQPIGRTLPYEDPEFRSAYLLAYFPYYIEPICHVLHKEKLPDSFFSNDAFKVAFLGGGPCPEVLGLAAYLKKKAPRLSKVEATVFDRQSGWDRIQQELVPSMMPSYKSGHTTFSVESKSCDLVDLECTCGMEDKDIIVAQNLLTEVYTDKQMAIETFERFIRSSQCRYIVFIDNMYPQIMEMMNELSAHLYSRGLSKKLARAETTVIRPNFRLSQEMQQHLFTGENGLQVKKNVKFHHMVIEIARS